MKVNKCCSFLPGQVATMLVSGVFKMVSLHKTGCVPISRKDIMSWMDRESSQILQHFFLLSVYGFLNEGINFRNTFLGGGEGVKLWDSLEQAGLTVSLTSAADSFVFLPMFLNQAYEFETSSGYLIWSGTIVCQMLLLPVSRASAVRRESPFLWTLPIWLLCFLAVGADRHLHWAEGDVLAVKHFHYA